MRAVKVVLGPFTTPNATNIRTASSVSGAGAVTLNGSLVTSGVATLDRARRVLFTSSGNDSGITFTLVGTDWNGNTATEVLTGSNGATVYTVYDYATVSSVVASGASAGTVSIGTNGVASSRPMFLDGYAGAETYIQVNVSGTIGYTLQTSADNPNGLSPEATSYVNCLWTNSSSPQFVAATAAATGTMTGTPAMARLLLSNAGTDTAATATATLRQSGMVSY